MDRWRSLKTWQKWVAGIAAVFVALIVIGALVPSSDDGDDGTVKAERTAPNNATSVPEDTAEPEPTKEPEATISQQNALRSAESYLEYSAFSHSGLVAQLEYEGFSAEDATWGVDRVSVDWNEQAAKSAESYLEYSAFSRSGLVDQLLYEGFTPEQAEYGVSQTGL